MSFGSFPFGGVPFGGEEFVQPYSGSGTLQQSSATCSGSGQSTGGEPGASGDRQLLEWLSGGEPPAWAPQKRKKRRQQSAPSERFVYLAQGSLSQKATATVSGEASLAVVAAGKLFAAPRAFNGSANIAFRAVGKFKTGKRALRGVGTPALSGEGRIILYRRMNQRARDEKDILTLMLVASAED